LRSICKQAVGSVDWEKVHGSSDADWGTSDPNWDSWDETYGALKLTKASIS
jgi:alkylated DNA repair protein alkB family protein 1